MAYWRQYSINKKWRRNSMKKFVKLISLVLALLMIIATFAACAKKDGGEETTAAGTKAPTVEGGVADIEVINWDGQEYRILGKNSSSYNWATSFEVWCGEENKIPEDVVGKAVWNRNQDMLQNYGIKVVGYLDKNYNDTAKTAIDSGDDLYDLMLLSPEAFHPFAIAGSLIDLNTLDYINLEHDGWMDYPNENLTIGGKLFYTTNKFLIQDKNRYWGIFYNRDLSKNLNLGKFEDLVFDGTWTMDKVIEVAKKATFESDGKADVLGKGDNFGVGASECYNILQLYFGVGFRLSEIDATGYPALTGATDDMIKRLDKVFELTKDVNAFYCDEYNGTVDWKDCVIQQFFKGKVLLEPIVLSDLQTLSSNVTFSYGVLPNPKYTEDQEQYHTIPNLGNGSLLGVPVTVVDVPFAGYALELITEKSATTTYTAFIEETCKLQKIQDEDTAKCLELIYQGVVFDVVFVSNIGGLANTLWNNVAKVKTNQWARQFGMKETAAQTAIEEIKTKYEALDQAQ